MMLVVVAGMDTYICTELWLHAPLQPFCQETNTSYLFMYLRGAASSATTPSKVEE